MTGGPALATPSHRAVRPSRGPLVRRILVGAGLVATAAGSLLMLRGAVSGARIVLLQPTARTPTQLAGCLCAGAAGALLGWLALGGLLAALAGLPGAAGHQASRLAVRLTPTVLRTVVAAGLGGSLAMSALALPGAAGSGAGGRPAAQRPVAAAAIEAGRPGVVHDPGWRPAPPSRPAPPPPDVGLVSTRPSPGRSVDDEVVVRPADTLWAIAARHLGPTATAAEIAAAWPRWFVANRRVIGPDPDCLLPGQRLVPPPPSAAGRPR